MAIRVTLSANAGVSVELGGVRVRIDALHDTRVPGFSTLDSHLLRRLWSEAAFQSPDAIVYTHCHPDHYAAHLTAEACRRWPKARLFLPRKDFPEQELLSGRETAASIGGVALHFYRLTHDGMAFAGVPHYGLTITCGKDSVLLPGDCAVASPELLPVVDGRHLRLALLNFPWITLRRGQDFLREHLHADHIALYHLPFAEDDTEGFCTAADRAAQSLSGVGAVHVLDNRFQTLFIQDETQPGPHS